MTAANGASPGGSRKSSPFPIAKGASGLDVDKATAWLHANASHSVLGSKGKCATYIRLALAAGGVKLQTYPVSAKDYGSYLKTAGFAANLGDDVLPGDIVVIQSPNAKHPDGHIAMYDGTRWISDFYQNDFWGGPTYRLDQPSHKFYRP